MAIDADIAQRALDALKKYGTITEAARALNIPRSTFYGRLDAAQRKEEIHDLPDKEPLDHIVERRLRDQLADANRRATEAERRASEAEDYRTAVLGLSEVPAKPAIVKSHKKHLKGGARTILAALTDVHFGEVVNAQEMDNLNSFNQDICKARMGRHFATLADLATEHWAGPPPDEIVIWVGGDLISGALHPELVATDDLTIPEGVKTAGEHIAGGLLHLAKKTRLPIRVHESVGNHGRATIKPQSKLVIRNSFDALALDFAEVALKYADVDITFHRCHSIDTMVEIYGWRFLLTHGDRMGAGGGRGYIGAAAPITKGHQKLVTEYAKLGRRPHYIMTAHFHTTMRSPWGYSNGCYPGFNEFARQNRLELEGAMQTMLVVAANRGVISQHDIFLGVPEEGSLYELPLIM